MLSLMNQRVPKALNCSAEVVHFKHLWVKRHLKNTCINCYPFSLKTISLQAIKKLYTILYRPCLMTESQLSFHARILSNWFCLETPDQLSNMEPFMESNSTQKNV